MTIEIILHRYQETPGFLVKGQTLNNLVSRCQERPKQGKRTTLLLKNDFLYIF